MKKTFLLCLLPFLAFRGFAQYSPTSNSIRMGLNLMTLGGSTGLHYQAQYAKHLASDRILLALSLGYFQRNQREYVTPNRYAGLTMDGNKQSRVTSDLSLLVDLLPATRHALRIGGGLSYWYRSDDLVTGSSLKWSSSNGIYDIEQSRASEQEWNLGYHLRLEYEQRLSSKLALSGEVGWANFTKSRLLSGGSPLSVFQSTQAGLGLRYLFF